MLSKFAKIFDYLFRNEILHLILANLKITQFISGTIDVGKQVDIVYTDLANTYDTLVQYLQCCFSLNMFVTFAIMIIFLHPLLISLQLYMDLI